MKALVWEAPRVMNLRELPEPVPQPDEVLVRVRYAGICGSELSGYLGHNALRVPPLVMGHEFSGEIAAMGSEAAQQFPELTVGRKVTVNPLASRIGTEWDRKGLEHLSPHRQLLGAHRPGAYAEYVAVPARSAIPLPESVSLRTGALAEPTACGVRVAELAGDVAGADCLVIGAGPIGLLVLQNLLLRDAARVFVAEIDQARLDMARELGGVTLNPKEVEVVETVMGATGGAGVVVAVDAVGTAITREQCICATMPTGTVIFSGLHEERSVVPAADIIRREIVVRGAFAYTAANFANAVQLLEKGLVRLDPWVVEAPLEEGGKWFERLLGGAGGVAKVLLKP
ncbi:MAG: hypothetical protein D6775_10455 [Caldilineae bacterium]|nr:MAG: hypothetical protein D6775_10455 [Caldilineae bacterium]